MFDLQTTLDTMVPQGAWGTPSFQKNVVSNFYRRRERLIRLVSPAAMPTLPTCLVAVRLAVVSIFCFSDHADSLYSADNVANTLNVAAACTSTSLQDSHPDFLIEDLQSY